MKKVCGTLVLAVLAALVFGGMIRAEERGKGGAVRGTFVRLVEREVGERGYMGIVIKPFDSDDHVTVLVPRQREGLVRAVRRLQEGQRIRVSFVSEGGHMWLRGMGAERREEVEERRDAERTVDIRREVLRWREGGRDSPEAERPMVHLEQMEGQLKEVVSGHLERMGRALREVLGAHLERMEGECRELRAHVERMERELDELRLRMGLVFQGAALFDSMTVADNVGFGLVEHRRMGGDTLAGRVRELLEMVDMAETENLMPAELSGGMRKRVGVARALALAPAIVLYDEPTAGLDPISAAAIDELIVRLQQQLGVTSVIVSHDVQNLRRVCGRVALLHQGRFIAIGSMSELESSGDPGIRQFLSGSHEGPLTE